jgi:hypothetical protein
VLPILVIPIEFDPAGHRYDCIATYIRSGSGAETV